MAGRSATQGEQTTVLAFHFPDGSIALEPRLSRMPEIPDTDDLELLDTTEGIEFYKDGENVVISSESIRAGEDGVRITYDSLVNAVVELRDQYREGE